MTHLRSLVEKCFDDAVNGKKCNVATKNLILLPITLDHDIMDVFSEELLEAIEDELEVIFKRHDVDIFDIGGIILLGADFLSHETFCYWMKESDYFRKMIKEACKSED